MMLRLETVDVGLVALVEGASDAHRRRAALAAAGFARARTGLNDETVDALLAAVGRGEVGRTVERRAVDEVVDLLDAQQWEFQDRVDAGEASPEDHLRAFCKARAASSAAFCADEDARAAAFEALYEAHVAVGDLVGLVEVVAPILS